MVKRRGGWGWHWVVFMLLVLLVAIFGTGGGSRPAPVSVAAPPLPPAVPALAVVAEALPDPPEQPVPVPVAAPEPKPAAPARVPVDQRHPVPILMYHELGDGPNNLFVAEHEFRNQLQHLADGGYTPVTLDLAYRYLVEGEPLPHRPVVLTFDDGYASFYHVALPLLAERNWPATLFVVAGLTGAPGYLSWEQVTVLDRAGMEIAAHTMTHPDLRQLRGEALRRELIDARSLLEWHLERPVWYFAYPAGRYDDRVLAAVREAGYLSAVTTAPGPATAADDPLLWPRLRVWRGQSLATFARLLADASGP